jgi:hypothetical protein
MVRGDHPQKRSGFRRLVSLLCSIGLIFAGLFLMVAWEHPLFAIWADPSLIFWDPDLALPRIGLPWLIGLTLFAAGAFWLAEDWFGFG